ncbi:chondroitinase-B domain-containing protein [Verrucomicrobiota bacterium]
MVSTSSREILVRGKDDFDSIKGRLQPGDCIVVADGVYPDWELILEGRGTAAAPVEIRAETPGKAVFTAKSVLRLWGSYLQARGLLFKNGDADIPWERVIWLEGDHLQVGHTAVMNHGSVHWIYIAEGSTYAEVHHCRFAHKRSRGQLFHARETGDVEAFHDIHHNHFVDHNPTDTRWPLITLQFGFGATRMRSICRHNLFEDNGVQPFCSKAAHIEVAENVFRNCTRADVCFRGLPDNILRDNLFLGDSGGTCNGVRFCGERITVTGNVFKDLESAVILCAGCYGQDQEVREDEGGGRLQFYATTKDGLIENNRMINCKTAIWSGWQNPAGVDFEAPERIEITGNRVVGGEGPLVRMDFPIVDGTIRDNLCADRQQVMPGFDAGPLDRPDTECPLQWPFDPEGIGPDWQPS